MKNQIEINFSELILFETAFKPYPPFLIDRFLIEYKEKIFDKYKKGYPYLRTYVHMTNTFYKPIHFNNLIILL